MRYDTPVFFQTLTKIYNTQTGDYTEEVTSEVCKFASVVGTSIDVMHLVYGAIRQGSKTVTLQNHYAEPYDRIRIGQTVYAVDVIIPHRVKQAYVVSEIQGIRTDEDVSI